MVKPLPPKVNGVSLSQEFINQFKNKTHKICNDLDEENKQKQIFREENSNYDTKLILHTPEAERKEE